MEQLQQEKSLTTKLRLSIRQLTTIRAVYLEDKFETVTARGAVTIGEVILTTN